MEDQLGILDLLTIRGFDSHCNSKLVRHQDNDGRLINEGWLDRYQALQSKPIFRDCDFIVALIGDEGTRAKFHGVYRVLEERKATPDDITTDSPMAEWSYQERYYYELKHQPQYTSLEGRVVIEWGAGTLAWHQYMANKPIIEIYPPGRALQPFSDYLDFTLQYRELQELMANPAAHRD